MSRLHGQLLVVWCCRRRRHCSLLIAAHFPARKSKKLVWRFRQPARQPFVWCCRSRNRRGCEGAASQARGLGVRGGLANQMASIAGYGGASGGKFRALPSLPSTPLMSAMARAFPSLRHHWTDILIPRNPRPLVIAGPKVDSATSEALFATMFLDNSNAPDLAAKE